MHDLHGALADVVLGAVVGDAVAEYQQHVACELLRLLIATVLQVFFYGAEVHGMLDLGEVVGDVVLGGVYWLVEEVAALGLPADRQGLLSKLLPALLDRNVFDAVQLGLLDGVRITQNFL